ncbi:MAG: bifunctional 4-hydroxy-2-oxoglutarate aldolase/2-dehydro-3-deoxy-phosphogluconate aldolase [Amphritea sp.]|nr:bifunctional 4-hydroxy-2-oxoglutarate aldolase/2-dehydro-3-deoxy-phosphogluconate aldolase [Amphritea sp.]
MKTNISALLHVLESSPIIPVIAIQKLEHAAPLASALADGGLPVIEVTLRTPAALQAIETIRKTVPEVTVGAGTILNPAQFQEAIEYGSQFIVSPGSTTALLEYGTTQDTPFLPGIQTVSELMTGIEAGYRVFKFFPAAISGGVAAIRSLQGPFADIRFCPTGGITADNVSDYLALENVICAGGTWLAPQAMVEAEDWQGITRLARDAVSRVTEPNN